MVDIKSHDLGCLKNDQQSVLYKTFYTYKTSLSI